jgi:aryl carrier-like protein
MLTGTPTAAEIEATIHRTIVELLERAGKTVPAFDQDDDLVATGLTSLDLAALVAKLARQWRIDPFLETKAITEVRTVGDLCDAYRESLGAR